MDLQSLSTVEVSVCDENEGDQCQPASLRESSLGSEEELQLTRLRTEFQHDIEIEKKRLSQALLTYQANTKGSKYNIDLDIHVLHTWSEVLEAVDEASAQYAQVPGLWGKIRRNLRRFGRNNKVFTAWAEILPSQSEYFSVLCGGLKLIFGAIARLQDLRTEVSDILEELPTILSNTHKSMGIFRTSKELEVGSMTLYISTIAVLEHIVGWYAEKALKKLSKSLFKQDSYQRQLSEKIQTLRKCSEHFNHAVSLCSYEHIVSTRLDIHDHKKLTKTNHDILLQRLKDSEVQSAMRGGIIGNTVVSEGEATRRMIYIMGNRVQELEATVSRFVGSGFCQNYQGNWHPRLLDFAQQPTYHSNSQMTSLPAICDGPPVHEKDLKTNRRPIEALSRPTQDRVVAIIKSSHFQNWMASPTSETLFINFNSQNGGQGSPSKFLCTKLIDSIDQESPYILPLSFFCSEHVIQDDPYSYATGMLESLIGQLLLRLPALNILHPTRTQRNKTNSIDFLCNIFESIILELPPNLIVFCAIEGLNIHEGIESKTKDFEEAIETLINIAKRSKFGGCSFKLILLCPRNSHALYKLMPNQEKTVLWIPATVPAQGGLTNAKWQSLLSRNFQFLD